MSADGMSLPAIARIIELEERVRELHFRVRDLEARVQTELQNRPGARVFATAGGPDKVQICRDLGAELAADLDRLLTRTLARLGQRRAETVR